KPFNKYAMQQYGTIRNSTSPEAKKAKWASQQQRIFQSLYRQPQTRLQVSARENVPLQNTCRYCANFRKSGKLFVVKIDVDPISGVRAEYVSTNPKYGTGYQTSIFGV